MIPTFPEFKKLEWSDREAVLQFTATFQPYSDFNFVSMWAWNTREKMMLSQLHGNLILLFYDYVTELPFLAFIGTNRLGETANALIDHSQLRYGKSALKLIPEQVAKNLCGSEFNISEDPDAHDYIMLVSYLAKLDVLPRSSVHAAKDCKMFLKSYPNHSVGVCTIREACKDEYTDLFKHWAKVKNLEHWELNEYSAFLKFIDNDEIDNHIISLREGGKLIGFVTYEVVQDYAVCHFCKADHSYKGIYSGLFFQMAKILEAENIRYWNFEQDLGIESLRVSKQKYRPEFFLKKYIIERKN